MFHSFGLTEREMRRLSTMRTREDPLVEELLGILILGSMLGLHFGLRLDRPLLGFILGFSQIGPVIGFSPGPLGSAARLAGWQAWRQSRRLLALAWWVRRIAQREAGLWLMLCREAERIGIFKMTKLVCASVRERFVRPFVALRNVVSHATERCAHIERLLLTGPDPIKLSVGQTS